MSAIRDEEIKSIHLLGTTWHKRGVRYWIRRTLLVLLWTGVLALSTGVVGMLFDVVARNSTGAGRVVVLVLMACAVCGSFIWGFSIMRRSEEEKKLGVPMIMRSGRPVGDYPEAKWHGAAAGLVAGPAVLVSQLFIVGVMVALVVGLLQKYISIEEFEAATGRKAPPRVKRPSAWSRLRGRG